MKNVRPIKTGKKIGTTYKDYTHNFKPQEVKMTNKVLREKSNCVVCRSSKSRFLKQKIISATTYSFHKLQNMHMYC